jgi:penicillin-binding protein 1A
MPTNAVNALIAVEDKRFRDHHGLDPLGIGRAISRTVLGAREGGSTITQQLVKNTLFFAANPMVRKIREASWALEFENRLTKEQIVEAYLNRVGFGRDGSREIVGVEQASRHFFGKHATDLTLYESAMLAGLVQAPNFNNPLRHPQRARNRAALVLRRMHDQGFISSADMQRALKAKTGKGDVQPVWIECRFFVELALAELRRANIKPSPGLRLFVTLDTVKQYWAERAVRNFLSRNRSKRVKEGALVSLDTAGRVRALVGGTQYGQGHKNRAVLAKRQPGSVFKLFVFAAALEKGLISETSRIRHGSYAGHSCSLTEGDGNAALLTATQAMARSSNSAALRLAEEVGLKAVAMTARRLGITSKLREDCSLPLGGSEVTLLELTLAYAAIANGGRKVESSAVVAAAKEGELAMLPASDRSQVISKSTAAAVGRMLRSVVTQGTGKAALGIPAAAGKTGTTNDNRDAWLIGYQDKSVTGVWFGNDNASPTRGLTGGDAAWAWMNYRANVSQQ